MKKLLFLFAVLLCLLGVQPGFAENFYIKNYDVNINVTSDKTVFVTEAIDVFFTQHSHGIIRNIPTKSSKISNVKTSDNFVTFKNTSTYSIKIGDANKYITGDKTYNISFVQKILDGKNEFYYNLIGSQWAVPIDKVTFSVKMPKAFDTQKVGLSIGSYGTKGFSGNARFFSDGQKVWGYTTQKLAPNQGVTLRIELPKDYFKNSLAETEYMVAGLMLILAIFAGFIWYLYGKDDKTIAVVNFEPPKGLNSAEVEIGYRGTTSEKTIVSLIFYLASRGFIQIIDNTNSFTLKKLKDYDGKNQAEKALMNALFFTDEVTKEYLETSPSFYRECEKIEADLKDLRIKIFEKESIGLGLKSLMFMILLALGVLVLYAAGNYDFSFFNADNLGLFIFPMIAIVCFISKPGIITALWALGFGGIPLLQIISELDFGMNNVVIVGIICIIAASICTYHLPKRNKTGQRLLGHILGFKKFLEVAEKDRIKKLINQNPSYCFDVIPFAYILGVSDEWIKNFRMFITESPEWYTGRHLNNDSFRSMSRSLHSVSVPSTANGGITSSSSSHGGGGFSGGGLGGGGGSSW